jgi:hydroxypyruvate reductase
VIVAAGEPDVKVDSPGVGGRNSHAALLAAIDLAGSDAVFASFATDGIDGRSDGAGAIVDGSTLERGGDPEPALARYDSAAYLDAAGDLVRTGPTGTNVADLWVLWRP